MCGARMQPTTETPAVIAPLHMRRPVAVPCPIYRTSTTGVVSFTPFARAFTK